jgi:hypothetical protein
MCTISYEDLYKPEIEPVLVWGGRSHYFLTIADKFMALATILRALSGGKIEARISYEGLYGFVRSFVAG